MAVAAKLSRREDQSGKHSKYGLHVNRIKCVVESFYKDTVIRRVIYLHVYGVPMSARCARYEMSPLLGILHH